MKKFISFSGGVESTTMCILYGADAKAIWCDAGAEHDEMYQRIDDCEKAIKLIHPNFEIIRLKASVKVKGTIVDNLIDAILGWKFMPSQGRRWCTGKFKIEPIDLFLKEQGDCELMIGLNADEEKREGNWGLMANVKYSYPLQEDDITRDECKDILIIEYEIYKQPQNASVILEFNNNYKSGLGIPQVIFNKENILVGDKQINSNIDVRCNNAYKNEVCLPNGNCVSWEDFNLNDLPLYPRIWGNNRIAIKTEDITISNTLNDLIKSFLRSEDPTKLIKEKSGLITFASPIKIEISGGNVEIPVKQIALSLKILKITASCKDFLSYSILFPNK